MKVVTIIQARTNSSRLPNKVLTDIYGKTLLERVIGQAKKIKNSDEVWVATSSQDQDDLIEWLCDRIGVNCYRGDLEDVRSRYYDIGKKQNADILVRITADNPFTEPSYAEDLINFLKEDRTGYDYVRMDRSKVPDGTYSEVFTMDALEKSIENYYDTENKEHVTPAMIGDMKMKELIPSDEDLIARKPYFVGVDTFADLKHATLLYKHFGEKDTLKQIINKVNKYGNAIQ